MLHEGTRVRALHEPLHGRDIYPYTRYSVKSKYLACGLSQIQAGDRHFGKNCVRGAGGLLPVFPGFDRNEQLIHSSRHGLISETAASIDGQDHSGKQFPHRGKPPERSEPFQAAQALAHSLLGPSAETRYPLIENGVYVGNIISETAEYLVQRISGTTAILHSKSMFSDLPQVGHFVRIAYYNESVAVREMAARQISKELAR